MTSPDSAPAASLYSYCWRNPNVEIAENEEVTNHSAYEVGDVVFVKPPDSRCTTRWIEGVVTGTLSKTSIEVDGVPRHVADCRGVPAKPEESTLVPAETDEDGGDGSDPMPALRRSTRERRPPAYLQDYVCDLGGCDNV